MRSLASLFILGTLTACGGSGSSVNPVVQTEQPVYQKGVFESSGTYKDSCESPRTGIDPSTGEAYADRQGLLVHENFWLRSWSDETYLWYDELPDLDPYDYDSPLTYFDLLKTDRTTSSGAPVDKFHFYADTAEYYARLTLGETFSYGAEYIVASPTVPREIRIAFVEPDSPADQAGWERGDYIVEIDGVDVESGTDAATLNAGLSPSSDDTTHTFVLRKNSSGEEVTSTVEAGSVNESAVFANTVISDGNDKFGVMVFNHHLATAEAELANTMQDFASQQVNELVVDLRYNGGGFLAIAAQLGYMIAGDNADGSVFETLVFNDKLVNRHPYTGQTLAPTPFFDETLGFSLVEGQSLPSLNLDRVYFIVSENTCSASESLINGLMGIDIDVVIVGGKTCGKPYGFFPLDNCGYTYSTIQVGGENDKGFGDFPDGFSPANSAINEGVLVAGCEVADDLDHALLDVNEARLAEVFYYREHGQCSSVSDVVTGSQKTQSATVNRSELLLRPEWQRNKEYRF